MSDSNSRPRRKAPKNSYTTSSGKTIKVNRSLTDRVRAGREAKAQRKAAYLSSLPKERWKRLLYRLQPRRMYRYWFSRDGAIMALKVMGIGFVVAFLLLVGLFAYFRKDLPKLSQINSGNSGGTISYYDRTGSVLLFQDYGAFKRLPVSSNNISPYLKDATVAIEDRNFYSEGAFNLRSIARAAVNNVRGGSTQGASTITEQLVKMDEGWTGDRTVSIKVKELILATEVEREYSKNDILTAYLNLAPYSGIDDGVQAASQDYFHENANQLTGTKGLAEAAMLAAIPESPTAFSPYSSPDWNPAISPADNYFDENGLIARQQYVLDQMASQGYITQAQANAAKKVNVLAAVQQMPADHYSGIQYPYFVLAAKEELEKDFPASVIKTGGWKVITTLSVPLQNLADTSLQSHAKLLNDDQADDAAFVAEDNSTGQILAMIGGMDFNTQQVNFAYDAPISPGSSIKPYSYATLINDNNNVGAGSMIEDKQQALPGYPCTDKATPEADPSGSNCLWDDTRHYYGNVTLRYALGSSLNVPAVKAFTSTDPNDTTTEDVNGEFNTSWRLPSINTTMKSINAFMDDPDGYKCYDPNLLQAQGRTILDATTSDETQCGAAAGIGNEAYTTLIDHTNGIATMAREGAAIPTTLILKVTNSAGTVLKQFTQPKATQVVRTDAAYIVTDMADDPGASYLEGSCNATSCSTGGQYPKFQRYKGWEIAIKTGTNQDLDGLMMSWDTQYTAGVWIGNYDRSPYGGTPEDVTDPIMREFMEGAIDQLGNVKPDNWAQPADIKVLPAYHSNVPYSDESPPPSVDVFPAWYVGGSSSKGSTTETIDKVSGLIATSCTPADAKETTGGTANAGTWNVDIYNDGSPNISGTTAPSTSTSQATDNVHSCSDSPPTATITAVNGMAVGGASGSTLTCPDTGCTIMVNVQQGTHLLTDPNYPQYPGTLTLTVNGQVVQSQPVSSSGDYQLTYTPAPGTSGSIQVTAQVTDSVLYQGSDTQTISVTPTTTGFRAPTTSGGAGNGGADGVGNIFAGTLRR
jgi:membrane peptidoglycan carboxypeptidase